MKTRFTKGLTIFGIGAVMFGAFAAGPAKADDRCNNRANFAVGFDNIRIGFNTGGRYIADYRFNDRDRDRGRDRRDGNDHRDDHGRSDRHDRR